MTVDKECNMTGMPPEGRFRISKHNRKTDRFEDRVRHIADTEKPVNVEPPLFERDEDHELRRRRSKQVLCARGGWRVARYGEQTLREAADRFGFSFTGFDTDPPDDICSYCWKKAREQLASEQDVKHDVLGDVGYRLRWKQKGRARDEWYDVIVRPTATIQDLDTELRSFSTIHGHHLRAYYCGPMEVLPDYQYDRAGRPSQDAGSDVTIGEVATAMKLWRDDRLTMDRDLSTPSRYYAIVKDVLTDAEITEILRNMDDANESEQVFKVKWRTQNSDSVTTVDAWPLPDLQYADEPTVTENAQLNADSEANQSEKETDESPEYVGGVGSGKSNSDHDPIEEWSITDRDT